jgi:hypothetical protein
MQIRYGFDIELELFQPTTIVTEMDVHPTRHSDVVEESGLHCNQDIRLEKFIDCFPYCLEAVWFNKRWMGKSSGRL